MPQNWPLGKDSGGVKVNNMICYLAVAMMWYIDLCRSVVPAWTDVTDEWTADEWNGSVCFCQSNLSANLIL